MTFSRHAPSGATLLLALFTLAACQEPPPAAEKPRPVRTVAIWTKASATLPPDWTSAGACA